MSNDLIVILFWLLGWVIMSVGYYIYNVYIDEGSETKKLYAWRAFWTGFFSWIGIIFVIIFLCVGGMFAFNEWVEDKLSK